MHTICNRNFKGFLNFFFYPAQQGPPAADASGSMRRHRCLIWHRRSTLPGCCSCPLAACEPALTHRAQARPQTTSFPHGPRVGPGPVWGSRNGGVFGARPRAQLPTARIWRRNCSTCAARCLTAPPCATAKREPVRGGAVRVHADRQETACSSAARRATPANPGRQEEPIALARSLGAQPKFPPKAAPRAEAKRRGAAAPSATPSGPLRGIALSR